MCSHLVTGPSNNGREDSTGSVISGKSSLDQARAVVAHKGGSLVVVAHGWFSGWSVKEASHRQRQSQQTYKYHDVLHYTLFMTYYTCINLINLHAKLQLLNINQTRLNLPATCASSLLPLKGLVKSYLLKTFSNAKERLEFNCRTAALFRAWLV